MKLKLGFSAQAPEEEKMLSVMKKVKSKNKILMIILHFLQIMFFLIEFALKIEVLSNGKIGRTLAKIRNEEKLKWLEIVIGEINGKL